MDKLIPIAVKGVTSGLIAYGFGKMLYGGMGSMNTMFGTYSLEGVTGLVVGTSQIGAELIVEYVLPEDSKRSWDDMLSGFLPPAAAAGASLIVPMMIAPGAINGASGMLVLAATAGASSIITQYTYDNLLAPYVEQMM